MFRVFFIFDAPVTVLATETKLGFFFSEYFPGKREYPGSEAALISRGGGGGGVGYSDSFNQSMNLYLYTKSYHFYMVFLGIVFKTRLKYSKKLLTKTLRIQKLTL